MRIIFIATVMLLLGACASVNTDDGKLSESEKLTIIDMARYTLTGNSKNKKHVTTQEADFVNKEMPDVRIRYTGPREGRMVITWTMKSKTVSFIYSGKFLTDDAMWQMGIARHKYQISEEKVKAFNKRPDLQASDFDDMRKKSAKP